LDADLDKLHCRTLLRLSGGRKMTGYHRESDDAHVDDRAGSSSSPSCSRLGAAWPSTS
jgi:hypothetical protein